MQDKDISSYEYCSVYILDNPYCIDNEYDYYIPADLRGYVFRGCFITVPFGKGNRKQMAIAVGLKRASDYKDVKPIVDVCRDKDPVTEDILKTCFYVKDQTLCTMGDAVRSAVPSAVLGKLSEYYYPCEQKDASRSLSCELDPADLFVYEYIKGRGYVSEDSLKARFGAGSASESLKKLLQKKYIGRDLRESGSASEQFDVYCTLSDRENARRILYGDSDLKLRSQKHKQIIEYLLENEGEIAVDTVLDATDASKAQLKALKEKGIVEEILKRVYRESISVNASERREITLTDEQNNAFSYIRSAIDSGKAQAILLHGVTGSGKTSVMMKAVEECVSRGKGAIMLLPEIALTPQTLGRFYSYFGNRIALVHSALSAGERYDAYSKIRSGEADIVIGTRSAIFAPVKDLGLIVIDEEHEATYKSETNPKYHARDVARFRCADMNAVMLLASATPSVESYTKACDGKYKLLTLKQRYNDAKLPTVDIYDMRNECRAGNMSPIGQRLREKLVSVTGRGEQAILFLNRRGYNTMISCRSCGESIKCPNCSVAMHYHTYKGNYDSGFLFCHLCGYKTSVPSSCPQCGSGHIQRLGFGTQKIEEELQELLPGRRIIRLDADTTSKKESHKDLLEAFRRHEGDVLLGTQMVTKGHDFPDVTLVGVLLADMSLYVDDYHANERTFSMLTQVIGRAGRGDREGYALIQTNNPDNDIIKRACTQDYEEFYKNEIRLRKLLTFPPYCDIALLTLTSSDEKQALMTATRLKEEIEVLTKDQFSDVRFLMFGPFEAPVYKMEGKYRIRIVIKCRINKRSRELFSHLLKTFGRENASRPILTVDFNPSGL